MIGFDDIHRFEVALAEYAGAPFAIMTDCCTHAIELCLRYNKVREVMLTPYTYLSLPMTFHKLDIDYKYHEQAEQTWIGEYAIGLTNIWDSARRLEQNMYIAGTMKCLSFGHGKPLHIGRGGAILLDNEQAYHDIIRMRYDGRDLNTKPWESQVEFKVGYHYKPTPEEAVQGLALLEGLKDLPKKPVFVEYPDLRKITIKN
jgi:dTDP-4-amino-4,6-dideoxygalactose transaminase